MKDFFTKLGISGVVLAIFLAIISLLCIYFFISLDRNQRALEEQGYRTLEKLGSSIKQKDAIYQTVVKNLFPYVEYSAEDSLPMIPAGFGMIAECLKPLQKQDTSQNDLLVYKLTARKNSERNFLPGQMGKPAAKGKPTLADLAKTDTVKPAGGEKKKKDSILMQVPWSDFMSQLMHRDLFSDYLLIRHNAITYSTLPGDVKLSRAVMMAAKNKSQQAENEFNLMSSQDAKDSPSLIQSGAIEKVTVEGKDYLLFLIPVNFRHDPNCYLGGFIEEKLFNQKKRSLPSDLLVFFIFTMLLIIASLPIIKVFIMSPREQLTRPGVTMIALSLATLALLLTIMLSQRLIRNKLTSDQFSQLRSLNKAVNSSFVQEKDTILAQLDWYNRKHPEMQTMPRMNPSMFDSTSYRYLMFNKPPYYPFFKTLSWADKNGRQRFMFTPYRKCIPARVTTRDYFINPEKYKHGDLWYNMEPIYLQTTGDWSVAFSMPPAIDSLKIIAMAASMYSIHLPVLQEGFAFCLIDKNGRVWRHSGDLLDLNDNLVSETRDNKSLKASLNSEESVSFDLEMRNKNYHAFISPIEDTDLFVVSMVNPARENSIGGLTSLFVLFFFAVIFIILMAFYLFTRLFHKHQSRLAGKEYFFNWLLPGNRITTGYTSLVKNNCLFLLALLGIKVLISFYPLPLAILMGLLFLVLILQAIVTYKVLNSPQRKVDQTHPSFIPGLFSPYTWFVLSWLLTGIILPAILLTSTLFADETTSYLQRQQQYLAHQLNDRTEILHKMYRDNIASRTGDSLFTLRNCQGRYFGAIDGTTLGSVNQECGKQNRHSGQQVLSVTRALFDRIMNETDPIATDPLIEAQYPDTTAPGALLLFKMRKYDNTNSKTNQTAILTTQNPWSSIVDPWHEGHVNNFAIFFWCYILLLLTATGFLVNYLVRLLFFSYESSDSRPELLAELHDLTDSEQDAIFISFHLPLNSLQNQQEWQCVDLEKAQPAGDPGYLHRIIVFNFETGIGSIDSFQERSKHLETLTADYQVILWLDKTPDQLIERYLDEWTGQDAARAGLLVPQFAKAVSGMRHIYPALNCDPVPDDGLCEKVRTLLAAEREFNPGMVAFDNKIKAEIRRCCVADSTACLERHAKDNRPCNGFEGLILKLKKLSFSFYEHVWDSLSDDEQFLLLDLAQDTLLNLKDRKTIAQLLGKGILRHQGRIEFVSPSFKNYILTEIDQSSFEKMQKKIEQEGTWNRFKVPVILVGTSLAVFLFITQQDFLSNMNTILISAGTLVGVYLKFSGLFSKMKDPG